MADPGLSAPVVRLVDTLCRQFENAWATEGQPRIEKFLGATDEPVRSALLERLLRIEMQQLRRRGERPGKAEYLRRFPGHNDLIGQVLAEAPPSPRPPAASTIQALTIDSSVQVGSGQGDDELCVRCPSCRTPVSFSSEEDLSNVSCPHCGSGFQLYGQETRTFQAGSRTVGHFVLQELLGSGAFGDVYRAWDSELQRAVAVKIPRKNQLEPSEVEQFLREARASARLRHPSIVSVHEVSSEDDLVYIVSDYVDGVTLADWLTAGRPTQREAARLCLKVARALQHAHEKGIVHRDLKPSNIMLNRAQPATGGSAGESEWEPFIMDFGLAKRDLGEVTMTAEGHVLGTPAYMSPEQARGDSHRADRRSDVYSLGVIFFELLTGERPFRGNVRMLIHQVIHDEPPSPRRLAGDVTRDAETITLKCLDKDPDRRFQTADELADELQRLLDGEPIRSRPITSAGRLLRWCQRRPVVATLAALLLAAVILGFAGVLWQRNRAESQRVVAEQERAAAQRNYGIAEANRQRAEDNRRRAEANLESAEANFQSALAAVEQMLVRVGDESLDDVPLMEQVRRELYEDAMQFYEDFLRDRPDDMLVRARRADMMRRVGEIYQQLGRLDEAESWLRRSMATSLALQQSGDVDARVGLSGAQAKLADLLEGRGRHEEAERLFLQALGWRQQLASDFPQDPGHQLNLAFLQHDFGAFLRSRGRFEQAEELYREALAAKQDLAAHDPENTELHLAQASTLHNLGVLLFETERLQEAGECLSAALSLKRRAHELFPEDRRHKSNLARSLHTAAFFYSETGRTHLAEPLYQQALDLRKQLAADFPNTVQYRLEQVGSLVGLSECLYAAGDWLAAKDLAAQAVALCEQSERQFPNSRQGHIVRAYAHDAYATTLDSMREDLAAESQYRQAIAEYQLGMGQPAEPENLRRLGHLLALLADMLARVHRKSEAQDYYAQALTTLRSVLEAAPERRRNRRTLAHAYGLLGDSHRSMQQTTEAVTAFRQGIGLLQALVDDTPHTAGTRSELASQLSRLGITLAPTAQRQEAFDSLTRAIELQSKLVEDHPDSRVYKSQLATSHSVLGSLCLQMSRPAEALEHQQIALRVREDLIADYPSVAVYQMNLAYTHRRLGTLYKSMGRYDEALVHCRRSLDAALSLMEQQPNVGEFRELASSSQMNLGNLYQSMEDLSAAEAAKSQALELARELVDEHPDATGYQKLLAQHLYNVGNMRRVAGNFDKAAENYREAAGLLESLLAQPDIENLELIQVLARCCMNLGVMLMDELDDTQQAAVWLAKAVAANREIYEKLPSQRSVPRNLRFAHAALAAAQNKQQQFPAAIEQWSQALQLADLDRDNPATVYSAACMCSLASGAAAQLPRIDEADRKQQQDQFAQRALELLRRAEELGHFKSAANIQRLKTSADLDPIRQRPQFQELLQSLAPE